jgi:DNA-binding NarL/FixJ family response regulator
MADQPTAIVLDDHALFRSRMVSGLRERGVTVLAEDTLHLGSVRLAEQLRPDVVVLDPKSPGMSGAEATHRLAASAPKVRVLILTDSEDERAVMDALLAGASGYLLKDSSIDHVAEGIAAATRGESMITPRVASRLVGRLREPDQASPVLGAVALTGREQEVLELIVLGVENAEISERLQISVHTVKNHVSSILDKLGVENRVQAAVRAVRGRLL